MIARALPRCFVAAAAFTLVPGVGWADQGAGAGHGAIAPVLLALALILAAAKIGGDLAVRVGQPAVLGELVLGVIVGNLDLAGLSALEWIATDPSIEMLAQLGVIVLLFEVGLESTIAQMMKVGLS